jgi:hypothetical protein
MKEFMLLVRTEGDHLQALSPAEQQDHIQKLGNYITGLMNEGKLKDAQPLLMEGKIVSGKRGMLKDGPYNEAKEVIAGYFHIFAKDMDEAIKIAEANPMFDLGVGRIEVRPVKTMEGIN